MVLDIYIIYIAGIRSRYIIDTGYNITDHNFSVINHRLVHSDTNMFEVYPQKQVSLSFSSPITIGIQLAKSCALVCWVLLMPAVFCSDSKACPLCCKVKIQRHIQYVFF